MWAGRKAAAPGRVEGAAGRRRPGLRDVAEAGAVTAVVCVLEGVVLAGTAEYRGFVAGIVAATTFWLVAARLLGAAPREAADPRGLTRELVDAVPHWRSVHDLDVDGRTLDHVVVTPLAVLTVRSEHWDADGERAPAVAAASDDARHLAHALARRGIEVPVWPAVVAWGAGAGRTELGPVDVVAGTDADSWVAAYAAGAIGRRRAEQVHAELVRLGSGRERLLDLREPAPAAPVPTPR
jgi:hypothetical protein